MKTITAVLAVLVLGYIVGVNAPWVSNAIYVSRITHVSLWQVLDPLHRHWLDTASAPFDMDPVDNDENQDDELLARTVEGNQG